MPLPDNKVGKVLSKSVRGPKPLRKFWNYVVQSRQELKKVTWPSRGESMRLTFAVILFAVFFAGFTTVVDLGFERVVQALFL